MISALTACGGGGGGGSSDPGPSAAAAGLTASGATFYLGKGDWSGNLTAVNPSSQQYQMFMWQYGNSQQFTTLVNLRIWSGYRGVLPEQVGFSINSRRSGGDGFWNGNGLLINNYQQYGTYYGQQPWPNYGYAGYQYPQTTCYAYPCNTQAYIPGYNPATATPVLQITTQIVDTCRNIMSVQVRYQQVLILTGQISGPVKYSPMYVNPFGYQNGMFGSPYAGYPNNGVPPGYAAGYPGSAGYPGVSAMAGTQIAPQCYQTAPNYPNGAGRVY